MSADVKNKCVECAECNECERTDTCNVVFTEEMRKTYKILIPTMLPRHFKILANVFSYYGYNTELLEDGTHGDSKTVIDAGLKYVHNDSCYPALLVIGQFIAALQSGRYDTHKVALMLTQTGGGCRASNYISLLRKALVRAGFEYVPVISLNFSGLESCPGFKLTLPMIHRLLYGILYGDLLLTLVNQTRPYELEKGRAEALADEWSERLAREMTASRIRYSEVKKTYRRIIDSFAAIDVGGRDRRTAPAVRVGIVGEIFVKFSPLGNNQLEDFLVSEGAEPVLSGLIDFCLYVVTNSIVDYELYGIGKMKAKIYKIADKFFLRKQKDLIDIIDKEGSFNPPTPFAHTRTLARGYVGMGAKMGEGWLLTAEMLELIDEGVNNVICTQPFGCLPNHIVGKGMMKPIKERYPHVNLVAIDYDAGATKINQENRIKLMLANAIPTPPCHHGTR
ncbi:MAG: 2-hydroxyacyl-CoA dehydratase [Clostridia bacterium]|nr:2-hydroxyacyl-CoA dehydratase [Clostridia bacterium]